MNTKMTELAGEFHKLAAQQDKVNGEYRSSINNLKASVAALEAKLSDEIISDEAQAALDEVKAKLQEADDITPDLPPPAPAPAPVEPPVDTTSTPAVAQQ